MIIHIFERAKISLNLFLQNFIKNGARALIAKKQVFFETN